MSGAIFYLKRNDTSPALLATLKDGAGTPVTLTGAQAIRFHMGRRGATRKVDAAATLVDGPNGVVKYEWQAADTTDNGKYEAEFEVTYADGTIETFPNKGYILVVIGEDLGDD